MSTQAWGETGIRFYLHFQPFLQEYDSEDSGIETEWLITTFPFCSRNWLESANELTLFCLELKMSSVKTRGATVANKENEMAKGTVQINQSFWIDFSGSEWEAKIYY